MQIQSLPLSISELNWIQSLQAFNNLVETFTSVRFSLLAYVWNKYICKESFSSPAWMNTDIFFLILQLVPR